MSEEAAQKPGWPTCDTDGCRGVRLVDQEKCLAHGDSQAFLAALRPGSDLDLRGVPLGPDLLHQVLTALEPKDQHPILGHAQFDSAEFSGKEVDFNAVEFRGPARFTGARFSGDAWFVSARFRGNARFDQAQFSGFALFDGAQFSESALFSYAEFSSEPWFTETEFSKQAEFEGANFRQAGRFGPILATSSVILDNVTFEHDVVIEVASPMLFCLGTRFAEAATLRLRHTSVVLDGAVFAKPSTIAFAPDAFKRLNVFTDEDEEPFDESPAARAISGRSARPSLLSLRGVDVATLTLSELDLSACLFQGAHHLDQLRIEGARPFADTPTGWKFGRVGGQGMPVWHWTRRQTLAEEHHWRANRQLPAAPSGRPHPQRVGWYSPDENLIPRWVVLRTRQGVERLTPDRLAALYRALRNVQEDSKNEPGAADFYYGEMEMVRLDPQTPWAERVIMWLYWLVSGYGLRGLRALAWLVAVVVGLAVLLQVIGFNGGDPGFRDALIYAAQSTIFIATGNKALTEHVSWAGEVLRIPLRLAGPVLLGLALLSARNRVKR
jgi:uncharacterized protein YjbI with pentapeptide repeats